MIRDKSVKKTAKLPKGVIVMAPPSFRRERVLLKRGIWPVAGCDEAGRGPLAGPVVAAAVVLDPDRIPKGIDDSKRLTAERREELFEEICATSSCKLNVTSKPRREASRPSSKTLPKTKLDGRSWCVLRRTASPRASPLSPVRR